MTEQEALDTAARATGRNDWDDVCQYDMGSVKACIRAHAASLQRIAELEAKLDALTPSEEERAALPDILDVLDAHDMLTDAQDTIVFTLLRKYVLQEQPVDPLVEALECALWDVSNVKLTDRELTIIANTIRKVNIP